MEQIFGDFFINCLALLAILNPFGNVPLCVTMSEGMNPRAQKKLFNLIIYTGFTIVVLFGLLGDIFMTYFFRVGMKEIRIAGGILLIVVALKNLLFFKSPKNKNIGEELSEEEEIQRGIIPLAFPIMVGPGTMTTIIIIQREFGPIHVIGSSLLVFSFIRLLLRYSYLIEKVLGKLVIFVLGRVMQIFIMAIGVKTLIAGIKELILNF